MMEVWGSVIATYTFIASVAVGAYIVSMLSTLFKLGGFKDIAPLALRISWASFIVLAIPLLLHLGSPWRAYKIFTSPNLTSPMAVAAWLVTLLVILTTILVVLDNWYRATRASTIVTLGAIGVVLAVIYAGYPGVLFATAKGVEAWWHNQALPITSILVSILSGLSLTLLAYILLWRFSKMEVSKATLEYSVRVLLLLLLLVFILEISDIILRTYEAKTWIAEFNKALTGPLSISYVGLQLILGSVIPLFLLALVLFRRVAMSAELMVIIVILILIGSFTYKWNLLIGGELVAMASTDVYTLGTYSIHFIEILATLLSWLFLISLSLVIFANWKVRVEKSGVEADV